MSNNTSKELMKQVFLDMTNVELWVQVKQGYNEVDGKREY